MSAGSPLGNIIFLYCKIKFYFEINQFSILSNLIQSKAKTVNQLSRGEINVANFIPHANGVSQGQTARQTL